ncbi:MAG TPA: ATP-binding cassette domain-containing protein [Candidatus Limnocylindria bacterium]|nr:ATP-binding cassette domain-containing protein [Candidatus Limnocylindria bacterium]
MDAPPPTVDARGLCKDYGGRRVVTDVSFALAPGECLGLLGPNGAGKTTTIRMVTCFTAPSAGTLAVLGLPATPANHAAIKSGLGIVQQDESLDPDLSVEQNLIVYASYFGIARRDAARRAAALMRFAELAEQRAARIRTLSGGMKRRLMLARALLNDPRLLVLDEPTTGLDPQARRLVWERIRTLKRQGTTILLTTHYMEEAAQLCDRTIIMDHGRIVAEGTPAELVAAHVGADVVEVYLSGTEADAARSVTRLGTGPWRAERVGQVLYLYLRDGEAAPRLLGELDGLHFARRRATLEDVFLTLTGHALRD